MNKLQRSTKNKVFSGVCGGIGEYFNIDPTLIRIILVLIGLSFNGILIVYLICSFIIPEDDGVIYSDDYNEHNEKIRQNTPIFIGGGLIIWGAFLLFKIFFPWFTIRLTRLWRYWPALLIFLGIYIIFNQRDR